MALSLVTDRPHPLVWGLRTINPIAEVQQIAPVFYVNANLVDYAKKVEVIEHLPFRIRFSAIGIESYNRSSPAAIGIAIIGYSNYVL